MPDADDTEAAGRAAGTLFKHFRRYLYLRRLGAAGGGKSYSLLLTPLRYKDTPGFNGMIFRKNFKQIFSPGGLWDEAGKMYSGISGATPKIASATWSFAGKDGVEKSKLSFAHIERYDEVYSYQGSQICFMGFDELTHFCLVPETEVLTEAGWKRIDEVEIGTMVPSLSIGGEVEMKRVIDAPSFDYQGQLVNVHTAKGPRFIATPNHKVPVMSQKKKDRPYYRLVEAGHLVNRRENIARVGFWKSGDELEYKCFAMPEGQGLGPNANAVSQVNGDDWLEFLGWYFAEGSAVLTAKTRGGTSPCVSIRQTKEQPSLRALMERLPWRVKNDGCGGYKIFSRQLYDELKPYGDQKCRRIPRDIYRLTKRQQEIFYEAFVLGDGHRVDGTDQIGLSNCGLRDDLQEMAVYLGRVASAGYYKTKTGFDVYNLSVRRKGGSQYGMVKPKDVSLEEYSGKVYCLTVADNHTFLIRYQGKVCWTGNSRETFFYMLSRNRSMCGVRPFVRGTCNPDADSWVADFISWWINQETGYPIPERSGKIRWMYRDGDALHWGDSRREMIERFDLKTEEELVRLKSVTFISSSIYDNKALLSVDPSYLGNLLSLPTVERERLLYGNWKIKPAAGMFFKRENVTVIDKAPKDLLLVCRAWDIAATAEKGTGDPDFTAGVLMGLKPDRSIVILDVINRRIKAGDVETFIYNTAVADRAKFGRRYRVRLPQDPGAAGKIVVSSFVKRLAGFSVSSQPVSGSKQLRATPFASQWKNGNVEVLDGDWLDAYFSQLESFPESKHDDMVDASSDSFNELTESNFNPRSLI